MSDELVFDPRTGTLKSRQRVSRPGLGGSLILIRQIPSILFISLLMVYLFPVYWPDLSIKWPFLQNMFMVIGNQFQLMDYYIKSPETLNYWYVFSPIMAVFTLAFFIMTFTCKKWGRNMDGFLYIKILLTLFIPVVFGLFNWFWELIPFCITGLIAVMMIIEFTENSSKIYRPLFVIHIGYTLLRGGMYIYGLFDSISWYRGLFDVFYFVFLAIWILLDMIAWRSGPEPINFKSRLFGLLIAFGIFLSVGYLFSNGTGSSPLNNSNGSLKGIIMTPANVVGNIDKMNPVIASLETGNEISVEDSVSKKGLIWYQVRINGISGYIPANSVYVTNRSLFVIGQSCNIREAPYLESKALFKVYKGNSLEYLDHSINNKELWFKVKHGQKTGYIRSDLVEAL